MDEPQIMDSFNGQNTFSEIKPRDIFRKGVIFDEHRHQVASRKKFHDKVEMGGILKGIIELDNPRRIRLCENVSLSAYVGELELN